ncbi:MAG: O-antigen ligase family protein, partial [Planctomycetota bacterium]
KSLFINKNALRAAEVGLVLFAGVLLLLPAFNELMQMNRNDGESESAQTAAYRAAMIREYVHICEENPWFGLGRGNIPVIQNMKSIDNQYLWLSLNYGIPSAALLLLAAFVGIGTLLPPILRNSHADPWYRLDAAIVGILLGAAGVQATVFAGTQTEQFFFLFLGLAGSSELAGRDCPSAVVNSPA